MNSPSVIAERLNCRDGKKYDIDLLERMQQAEVGSGRWNAKRLGVPFLKIDLYADKEPERTLSSFALTNI